MRFGHETQNPGDGLEELGWRRGAEGEVVSVEDFEEEFGRDGGGEGGGEGEEVRGLGYGVELGENEGKGERIGGTRESWRY